MGGQLMIIGIDGGGAFHIEGGHFKGIADGILYQPLHRCGGIGNGFAACFDHSLLGDYDFDGDLLYRCFHGLSLDRGGEHLLRHDGKLLFCTSCQQKKHGEDQKQSFHRYHSFAIL